MKKIISLISLLLLIGVTTTSAQCCSKSAKDKAAIGCNDLAKNDAAVKAYYFHATRRCATCQAVESVSKEAIKEYYGDKVAFETINREEHKDHPMIKEHKISGQTLLIVKGNEVVNLTNTAFLNARSNPDKLKAKIKETIDAMK